MKKITTEQLSKMSQDEIIAMFLGDIKFAEDEPETMQVKVLTFTCPTDITQGTTHTIKVATDPANPGTPDYVYKWNLADTPMETYPTSGKTADTSHVFTHTFNEAPGSYYLIGQIRDSCATREITRGEACTINIVAVACPDLQVNLTVV